MTIPRLAAMRKQWERWPPLHIMFAAWVGHKPPEKPTNDLNDLLKTLGGLPGLQIDPRIFEEAQGRA